MSVTVELFTAPNCANCSQALAVIHDFAKNLHAIEWREVNIIEELDYAVEMGVLSSPSIVIDGKLVFTGLPTPNALLAALKSSANGT